MESKTEKKAGHKKPMFFYGIGRGRLALEAQEMFEKVQHMAIESEQAISMTIKITVKPPAGDQFGKTQYALTHTQPVNKSLEFTTEYEGGRAVTDGESIERLLQLEMFPESIPESERID